MLFTIPASGLSKEGAGRAWGASNLSTPQAGRVRRWQPGKPDSAAEHQAARHGTSSMEVRVMVRRIRPPGSAIRAALAVAAMVTLAACGSEMAGGQVGSADGPSAAAASGGMGVRGVAVCRDISRLTSVVINQTAALHALERSGVLPRVFIVREPVAVRGLAASLCGLPAMPRGPVNCPAQFGAALGLAFAVGGHSFPPVIVQVSGCRVVTGLGPARTARSAVFWRTLGKDLRLTRPLGTSQGGINP